jgi:hypothetical protein
MKIEELENCPKWLKEANTENADVTIVDKLVHWHSGTWNNGVWEGGVWHNGTWNDGFWRTGTFLAGEWLDGYWYSGYWNSGTWCDGTWYNGDWIDGTWYKGTWKDGTWYNGLWNSGTWKHGTWKHGTWISGNWEGGIWKEAGNQHQRIKYSPSLREDKTISIGCKTKTRDEWDEWFAGKETFETPRGTDTFDLIEANYRAFIAYAEHLNLIPKK